MRENSMSNILLKLIGYKSIILHDDSAAYDRLKWLKSRLLSGDKRTLDAGCGTGGFSLFAAKKGNDVVGIPFDENANNLAKESAQILKISNVHFRSFDLRKLDQLSSELGKFDQIICLETIEHILNDKKLIKDLSSLLKPGGRLFLTTPYKNYKHLIGDGLSKVEDGGHVRWGYTHEDMRDLFREEGLRVISGEYISGFLSQQLTNLLRILGKVNKRFAWYATFPLRLLLPLDRLVTKLLKYPNLSIGVIGEKVSHNIK